MATQPDETAAFDEAFSQFSSPKEGEPPAAETPPAEPAPEVPAEVVEPAAEPEPGREPPAETPPAEEPPAEEPPAEPAPAEPEAPAADPDDILKRLSALVKEAPGAPAQPQTQDQPPQEEALYTEDETKILKAYEEDWPEVAKAEELKRRAEYREFAQVIFSEVGKYIAPINELVTELATRTHLGDLEARVPDYQELRDGVVQWVDTQPAWLQPAYKSVMQQGTADEVADLINRYRTDTGAAAPAAQPAKVQGELPASAKKAAKSMAPVTTKRTAIPQDDDMNDFDAAFAKFAGVKT